MASKKGIAITAAIAAAVIGGSSIIWFIPQGSGNYSPRTFQDDFSSIYSQNIDLAGNINATFQNWMAGAESSPDTLGNITQAQATTAGLEAKLASSNPPPEYQSSFSNYTSALKYFDNYLSGLKKTVEAAPATGNAPRMQGPESIAAWKQWQQKVDEAVGALPIGSR